MNGFILKASLIAIVSFASFQLVGCTRDQIREAEKVVAATTQAASNPVIVHSYPPYSEGASATVTGAGMLIMQILHSLERRADKKKNSGE